MQHCTFLGIYHEGDMCLDGMELNAMSDEELDQCLEKVRVYAVSHRSIRSVSWMHGSEKDDWLR